MRCLFFFLLILTSTFKVYAQEFRWVDLEWDPVPEAKEYEVELFQEADDEVLSRGKFKISDPKWSHSVPPGKYSLKLRSIDQRGVPGEWSESIPLKVKIISPVMTRPSIREKISESMVLFEWNHVIGASNYQLIIRNAKKDIVFNNTTINLKENVYLKDLGEYTWVVFALGDDDEAKTEGQIPEKAYRQFIRVGGELESPVVTVQIDESVIVSWDKIQDAQNYEVDYLPPPGSGEKNRRFRVATSKFQFPKEKLKEGTTTLTIKSIADGYQDSSKTIVKIVKKEKVISSTDVITGKSMALTKGLKDSFWHNQFFLGLAFARYNYESENFDTDTKLDQSDLNGIGLNLDWYYQTGPENNQHKFELSLLRLNSGNETGLQNRVAYDYLWPFKNETKLWSVGAGFSYLSLPTFFGDRSDDSVEVKNATSVGPELILVLVDQLNDQWQLDLNLVYAFHPISLASPSETGGDPFGWVRGQIKIIKYYSPKTAFFFGGEYQRWSQEFGDDTSTLSGWSLALGSKLNW